METAAHRAVLGSDAGVVLVVGAFAAPWDASTLVAVRPDDEGIWILTGDQWGPFEVEVRALGSAAGDPDETWSDVTEVGVVVRDGIRVCELVDQDHGMDIDIPAGTYRLRVSASGRGTQARERHLLELWPVASLEPPLDVRETSPHARARRAGPRPELVVAGQAEGLAASGRIGRDADRAAGARTLSGRTGTVAVERRIRQTRVRLFRRFRTEVPLSRHVPSWTSMSARDVAETYTYAGPEHPDQLSGSGYLRNIPVEETSPARHVRRTAWLVSTGGSRDLDLHVPLFEPDTTLTVTYDQERDADGQAWTTVTVRHEDVPVEWVDDLHAWWSYQLAFLEAELAVT